MTNGVGRALYGPTDRWAGKNAENYTAVMEWSKSARHQELLAHPAARAVREALASVTRVNTDLCCYSGRLSAAPLPSSEMWPPPAAEWPCAKRYALPDRSVLYLCRSEDGVRREVGLAGDEVLYVQRFPLPAGTVRLADFTALDEGNILNEAFWFAEVAHNGPETHSSMQFTQVLAELVAERFDGMVVPGVKGEQQSLYANVVVFTSGRCREWLDPTWTSTLLEDPVQRRFERNTNG